MSDWPRRSTVTTTHTHVRHIAVPLGRDRKNPPHLADLRAFVAACEGLPDEVYVHIDEGHLDSAGRRDVEFRVRYEHPAEEAPDA